MRIKKLLFISLVLFLTLLSLCLSQAKADSYLDVDVALNFVPPTTVPEGTTWSGSVNVDVVRLPDLPPYNLSTIYTITSPTLPTSQAWNFQFLINTTTYPTATNQLVLSNFGGSVLPPRGTLLPPMYYNNGWIAVPGSYLGNYPGTSMWAVGLPTLSPGMDVSGVLNTNPEVYGWYAGTWEVTVSETPEPASILLVGSLIGLIAVRKIFKTQFRPSRIPS